MTSDEEILYTANLSGSLRLSANGEWFHNGVRFQNERLSKLFHRSIVWDNLQNDYFVRIGKQQARFDRDDTAYFIASIDDSEEPWRLILADDSNQPLDPETLSLGAEDQIYCIIEGSHRARFTRQAYQILVKHVVDEERISIGSKVVCLKQL